MDLLDKREHERENIKKAYFRFIKGQFGIEILHDEQGIGFDVHEEIEPDQVWLQRQNRFNDDWEVSYDNIQEYENGKHEIYLDVCDQLTIDQDELMHELMYAKPNKSENDNPGDMFENESEWDELESKGPSTKQKVKDALKKNSKKVSDTMGKIFVHNDYIESLFPSLKIQKPGHDYYSLIVIIQVMIFFYILVFYTKLDKSGKTIFDQVDSNLYNSSMLYMLTIQLVFMIVDRYIYKSKSFVDKEEMKIDKPWEDINSQITKHKK